MRATSSAKMAEIMVTALGDVGLMRAHAVTRVREGTPVRTAPEMRHAELRPEGGCVTRRGTSMEIRYGEQAVADAAGCVRREGGARVTMPVTAERCWSL